MSGFTGWEQGQRNSGSVEGVDAEIAAPRLRDAAGTTSNARQANSIFRQMTLIVFVCCGTGLFAPARGFAQVSRLIPADKESTSTKSLEPDDSPRPPWIDDLLEPVGLESRMPVIRKWLAAHPRHPDSALVAERAYLFARDAEDIEPVDWLRTYLIQHHPGTVFTRFAAGDYRVRRFWGGYKFTLESYVTRMLFEPSVVAKRPDFDPSRTAERLRVVAAALESADQRDSLNNTHVLTQLRLATEICRDSKVTAFLRPKLERLAKPTQDILRIGLDGSKSPQQRLLEIERGRAGADRPTANLLQLYLAEKIDDSIEGDPETLRVLVERYLEREDHSSAQRCAKRWEEVAPSPHSGFVLGWCLAREGRIPDAVEKLRGVASSHPEDEWGRMAGTTAAAISKRTERIERLARQFHAAFAVWRRAPLQQCLLTLRPDRDQRQAEFAGLLDTVDENLVMVFAHGGTIAYGYESRRNELREYHVGDGRVTGVQAPGFFPGFKVSFVDKTGQQAVNIDFDTSENPMKTISDLKAFFADPMVSNLEVVTRVVAAKTATGFLVEEPGARDAKEQNWRFLCPELGRPAWTELRWTIGLDAPRIACSNLTTTYTLESPSEAVHPLIAAWRKLPSGGIANHRIVVTTNMLLLIQSQLTLLLTSPNPEPSEPNGTAAHEKKAKTTR
jgi:hypothetical protein